MIRLKNKPTSAGGQCLTILREITIVQEISTKLQEDYQVLKTELHLKNKNFILF